MKSSYNRKKYIMNVIQKISFYGFVAIATSQSMNAAEKNYEFKAISVSCIAPYQDNEINSPSNIELARYDINEIQLLAQRDSQLIAQKAARVQAIAIAERNRILAGTPSGIPRFIAKNHDGSPVLWNQLTLLSANENDPYNIQEILKEKGDAFTKDAESYHIEIKARQRAIAHAYDELHKQRKSN